jgi:hypothetical protein
VRTRVDRAGIVVIALLAAAPVQAASFWLKVAADVTVDTNEIKFDPTVTPTQGDADQFAIVLSDGATSERVDVMILKDGFAPFSMSVNLPYFWGSDRDNDTVAATVTPLSLSDDDIDQVREEGENWLKTSRATQVKLNRLARAAFLVLHKESHWPNLEDVKIASLFVRSSNQLVTSGYVEPDDDMRAAVVELGRLLDEHADLFESQKARDDAELAIREFNTFRRTQLTGVVNQVSADVGRETTPGTCGRSTTTFELFRQMTDETRKQLDPDRALETLNLGAMTHCLGEDLRADSQLSDAERKEKLKLAVRVVDQIDLALATYAGFVAADDSRLLHAQNGRSGLQRMIGFYQRHAST